MIIIDKQLSRHSIRAVDWIYSTHKTAKHTVRSRNVKTLDNTSKKKSCVVYTYCIICQFLFVHVRTSFVHGLRNSFEVTLVTRSIAGQLDPTPRATLDKHASFKIDNSNSKFMSIQIGAPQDSVVGPHSLPYTHSL